MSKEIDQIITEKYNEKPKNIRLENRVFTNRFRIREIKSSIERMEAKFKAFKREQNILIGNLNLSNRKDMKELGWLDEK